MAKTLRLIFPQWQGGEMHNIAGYVSELEPQEAMQGYCLGAHLLDWLAPKAQGGDSVCATVPVSLDSSAQAVHTEQGIFAYQANKRQQESALEILHRYQPARVLTLGGDCAVSVAPFSYLASVYTDDVAVVWLDAHPDLTLPHEGYTGFHAMALAALLGQGDAGILGLLPATIRAENALLVGLRSPEGRDMQRPDLLGVRWMPSAQVNRSSTEVLEWLGQRGVGRVMVHLDLDGLEPEELKIAVASDPGGLGLAATSRLINDIARHCDLVGLTIAEPMPREVIKLRRLLHSLPLVGE